MSDNKPDSKNIDEAIKLFPHIIDHLAQLKMNADGDNDPECNPNPPPEAPGSVQLKQDAKIDEKESNDSTTTNL